MYQTQVDALDGDIRREKLWGIPRETDFEELFLVNIDMDPEEMVCIVQLRDGRCRDVGQDLHDEFRRQIRERVECESRCKKGIVSIFRDRD